MSQDQIQLILEQFCKVVDQVILIVKDIDQFEGLKIGKCIDKHLIRERPYYSLLIDKSCYLKFFLVLQQIIGEKTEFTIKKYIEKEQKTLSIFIE